VIARALKKMRRGALSGRATSSPRPARLPRRARGAAHGDKDANGDQHVTKTVKLDVETEKTRLAPAARAMVRHPPSPVEGSSTLPRRSERVSAPTSAIASCSPGLRGRSVSCGGLRNDPGPPLLLIAVLAAALVGARLRLRELGELLLAALHEVTRHRDLVRWRAPREVHLRRPAAVALEVRSAEARASPDQVGI